MKFNTLTIVLIIGFAAAILLTGCEKEQPAGTQGNIESTSTVEGTTVQNTMATDADTIEQKLCPVMENPISEEVFIEHEGKKVYFCCPGCEEKFLENLEEYLAKLPQFQE